MQTYALFLGLGSNLGDRKGNLLRAGELIGEHIGSLEAASRIYRTAAWGRRDQPEYYNQVVKVATSLTPEAVLAEVLAIERQMGRVRRVKWEERLIDIDILFYDRRIIRTENLIVPHPFIQERRFVLEPLHEIAPDLRHPLLGKTVAELLAETPDVLPVEPVSF